MKKKPFIITVIMMFAILIAVIITKHFWAYNKNETLLTQSSQNYIDTIVKSDMKSGDIPGASILIIKDNKEKFSYSELGFSDKRKGDAHNTLWIFFLILLKDCWVIPR